MKGIQDKDLLKKYEKYKEEFTYFDDFIPPFLVINAGVDLTKRRIYLREKGVAKKVAKKHHQYKLRQSAVERAPINKFLEFRNNEVIKFIDENPQFKDLELPYP